MLVEKLKVIILTLALSVVAQQIVVCFKDFVARQQKQLNV